VNINNEFEKENLLLSLQLIKKDMCDFLQGFARNALSLNARLQTDCTYFMSDGHVAHAVNEFVEKLTHNLQIISQQKASALLKVAEYQAIVVDEEIKKEKAKWS